MHEGPPAARVRARVRSEARTLACVPRTRKHRITRNLTLTLTLALALTLTPTLTRGEAPTWVSTEGSGVAWLHARLDARPKYYHHAPYRAFAAPAALQRREQREEAAAGGARRRRGVARAD